MPETLSWIPLANILPHPRARAHDHAKLEELKESLKSRGQLEPCRGRILRRDSSASPQNDGGIELYIGNGRYQAAKALNWEKIMVIVEERTDDEVDLDILHENLKREDLDPIQEAKEYDYLIKTKGMSQAEVAKKVGMVQSKIAEITSLLSLPPEIQEIIRRGIISKSHGILIAKIKETEVKKAFADFIVKLDVSVKQATEFMSLYMPGNTTAFMGNMGLNPDGTPIKYTKEELNPDDEKDAPRKRKPKAAKPAANLWPGLPREVMFKSQGGRHTLSWPSGKYSKDLLRAIFNSSPEAIQPKKRNKGIAPAKAGVQTDLTPARGSG